MVAASGNRSQEWLAPGPGTWCLSPAVVASRQGDSEREETTVTTENAVPKEPHFSPKPSLPAERFSADGLGVSQPYALFLFPGEQSQYGYRASELNACVPGSSPPSTPRNYPANSYVSVKSQLSVPSSRSLSSDSSRTYTSGERPCQDPIRPSHHSLHNPLRRS